MNDAITRLASKISVVLLVALTLLVASSPTTSAQGGLEFPQQVRQRPVQRGDIAQASYHVPTNSRPLTADRQSMAESTVQASGFPSLAPANSSAPSQQQAKSSSFGPMVTTAFSLAVVLGLFAGLVWVSRRYGNGSMTQNRVPSDILKSLGSTAIDARTQVTMLRCGNRIIVIAQTANGIHPLSEITDPAEVNRLTIACTGSSGPTFAETLQQVDAAAMHDSSKQGPRGQLFASA